MPTKLIAVIYTIILGRKNYIGQMVSSSAMYKGQKVVQYTTDITQARDFGNEEEAAAFIPLIVNPAGRQFTAGTERISLSHQTATEEALR